MWITVRNTFLSNVMMMSKYTNQRNCMLRVVIRSFYVSQLMWCHLMGSIYRCSSNHITNGFNSNWKHSKSSSSNKFYYSCTAFYEPLLNERVQCSQSLCVQRTSKWETFISQKWQCHNDEHHLRWLNVVRHPNAYICVDFAFHLCALFMLNQKNIFWTEIDVIMDLIYLFTVMVKIVLFAYMRTYTIWKMYTHTMCGSSFEDGLNDFKIETCSITLHTRTNSLKLIS